MGDKGNLEHGTILCGGTVGPVLLSMAMCAGSSQELWEHGHGAGQAGAGPGTAGEDKRQ